MSQITIYYSKSLSLPLALTLFISLTLFPPLSFSLTVAKASLQMNKSSDRACPYCIFLSPSLSLCLSSHCLSLSLSLRSLSLFTQLETLVFRRTSDQACTYIVYSISLSLRIFLPTQLQTLVLRCTYRAIVPVHTTHCISFVSTLLSLYLPPSLTVSISLSLSLSPLPLSISLSPRSLSLSLASLRYISLILRCKCESSEEQVERSGLCIQCIAPLSLSPPLSLALVPSLHDLSLLLTSGVTFNQ